MVGDQVGDDLGVGLRGEVLAFGDQPLAQPAWFSTIPLRTMWTLPGAVVVRVGVLLGDPAVGGPAGVGDAGLAGARVPSPLAAPRSTAGAQVGEVADRVDPLDLAVVLEQADARRVIAPVFELFEPLEEELFAGALAHVSDDAAHRREERLERWPARS